MKLLAPALLALAFVADGGAVDVSLLLVAGVAYGLGRRKRR